MNAFDMSYSEIFQIADPIRQDVIDGSNAQDWELHSRNMRGKLFKTTT